MIAIANVVSVAVDLIASSLAPARCAACDERVGRLAAFCPPCAATTQRADVGGPHFAAFLYGGAVARAVIRFKYERRPDLARPMGDLMWTAVSARASELRDVVVVPVPLHPSRLVERGYNQAALLAGRIAWRLGAPIRATALCRIRDTPKQATLDHLTRSSNVDGAFRANPRVAMGPSVLLVDDVCTTRSTLRACAAALSRAGASSVWTAVLAQTE